MNRLGCETRKSYSGFTLIELLVVIAIIAILAAILFPVFTAARERSKQAKCLSNVGQIAKAIIMYADDWNGMYLWNADFEDKDEFGGDYLNAPYPWVILLKYTAGKEIWACPSDKGLTWPTTGQFDGKIRALTGPSVSIVSEMWKTDPGNPLLKDCWSSYVTNRICAWTDNNVRDPIKIDSVPNPAVAAAVFDCWEYSDSNVAQTGQWHVQRGPIYSWNFAFLDGHARSLTLAQVLKPDDARSKDGKDMSLFHNERYRP